MLQDLVHTKELILVLFSVLKEVTMFPCMVEYTRTVPAVVPMATKSLLLSSPLFS